MRIAFDITSMHIALGGVFWYDYNLIKALLSIDAENDYMLLDYTPIHGGWRVPPEVAQLGAPNAETVHVKGLRHYRLSRWHYAQGPLRSVLARGVDRVLDLPMSAVANASMRSRLRPALDGVEVFHVSDVLLWAQPGAVNVFTIHDLTTLLFPEFHTWENRELHRRRLDFAREHADVILVGSESTRRDIVQRLGVDRDRIRVVPYGVTPAYRRVEDPVRLASELQGYGLEPGRYIFHVGTIEPRKNLLRLVEAFDLLRKQGGEPSLKLALVGAGGWQHEDVLRRIETLGLEDWVVVTGPVAESIKPSLYSGAVLFVYPSLYEGFGLPPLEAMACGTPVIASNVSSIPEVVGEAGLLIDPEDTQSVADAMALVLSDTDLRAKMIKSGLARSRQFSWDLTAKRTLEVYRELS